MSEARKSTSPPMGELTDKVKIDVTLIPDHVRDSLAAATFEAVTRFLSQPGGREKLDAKVESLRKEGRLLCNKQSPFS